MSRTSFPKRLAAAVSIAGTLAVGGVTLPAAAAPASAPAPVSQGLVPVAAEGESSSISDNIGRLGLAGLTGMLGLFGYRKYRATRAARPPGDGPGRH